MFNELLSQLYNFRYDEDTLGLNAGVTLNFLSELVLYNNYLRKLICEDELLQFSKDDILDENCTFKHISGHQFLCKILEIVKLVGEIVSNLLNSGSSMVKTRYISSIFVIKNNFMQQSKGSSIPSNIVILH